PLPAIRMKLGLKRAAIGDEVVVLTDHSCTVPTLVDQAAKLGYRSTVSEVAAGLWQVTVRRDH
ncbi:MAG: sulfurtransferase TusA family protein, partial [Actinobacteria bacterium]|nr:sulfurtransferase TusA family protein [Actinomycetota bacterium]